MTIQPQHFETYEALILSGQIVQEDVPALLKNNRAFAEWYHRRAQARRGEPSRKPRR